MLVMLFLPTICACLKEKVGSSPSFFCCNMVGGVECGKGGVRGGGGLGIGGGG